MPRSSSLWAGALVVTGLIAAASGCTSDSARPQTTFPTTIATVPRVDDGILTIGVLIPQGSANADIGQAIRSAVRLAKVKINAAGGYNGHSVKLVEKDEGVTGVGVDPAIGELLDPKSNVDAIVGPASSNSALAGLGEIVQAGVVACSATASASLLDNFPDNNLFFRTIPSDSLEAIAIVEAVDRTGASTATITYIDDDYGQAFADSIGEALRRKGIVQKASIPYSAGNKSISAAAQEVAGQSSGTVVVIGDSTSGPVMLAAIDKVTGAARPHYVVNDAMRRPPTTAEPMSGSLAGRVTGISPVAYARDPQFLAQLGDTPDDPSPYAANAFDCVNLIALAALAADSTQPTLIAGEIPAVSDSGSPCMTFADCLGDIQAGSNINYDGPAGTVTLGSDGDVASAVFELFGFDDAGRDELLSDVFASYQ